MQTTNFPSEVIERLGFYVYAYVHPRKNEIFYIGKGQGDRAFDHLRECGETEKFARIQEIWAEGLEPRIDILVHGLTEKEALRIEAVCIETVGFDKLTNLVSGHSSSWGGRLCVENIIDDFSAEAIEISEPAIGITINKTYSYGMSAEELYEATRGVWWTSGREDCTLALAMYHGVVKEVYFIQKWCPAGTTDYKHRQFDPEDLQGLHEFIGETAQTHLRDKYIGKRLSVNGQEVKSGQNPIRYLNC